MAIQPVTIDVVLRGAPQIERGMRHVQDAAIRAERATQQAAEKAERAKQSIRERSATMAGKLAAKQAAEEKKNYERAVKDADRAERTKTLAMDREAKAQARIAERAARDEERAVAKSQANILRIRERSATMAGQYAARAAREEAQAAQKSARDQERIAASRARFATGLVGGAVRGVGAGLSRATSLGMGLVNTTMQLGGGFSIADSVAQRGNLDLAARKLSNSAYLPGTNQRPDIAKIIDRAKGASVATGIDATDLVAATQGYVAKSADFSGGMKNMQFFGEIAKGTGTDINDVAKTAGILRVQNKHLDDGAMKQMLLDVIMQGKQGSVEFEDLARVAGKVTRSSASYAGDQTDTQRKLLGLSQIAIRTSGSPDEAATVLANLSQDAMKHSADVGAVIGKDFLNSKGQIAKAPEEFIADVMEKSGGNLQKIQGMGFGARSMKMFQALAPTFNEADEGAGGGKAGRAAGRKAILDDMQSVTGARYGEKELAQDVKNIRAAPTEQFENAMRELKTAVGDALLPEFLKLVDVIKSSTPAFVDLLRTGVPVIAELIKSLAEFANAHKDTIKTLAANPIGTLVAFEITKSFAAAALPQLLQKLFTQSFGGGAGGGPGAAGGGGAGGALGPAAAAAIATYAIAKPGVDATLEGQKSGQFHAGQLQSDLVNGSPEARAKALAEIQKMQDESGGLKGILKLAGTIPRLANEGVYSAITGEKNEAAETIRKTVGAREVVDTPGIQEAVKNAIANGVAEGMRKAPTTNSGPDGAGRDVPIMYR